MEFLKNKKIRTGCLFAFCGIAAVFLLSLYLAASQTRFLPSWLRLPAPHPAPAATRDERWQQDLDYFASQMDHLHINPYHAASSEEFEEAVSQLKANIPTLTDMQITLEIARLTAMIGDGHTRIIPNPEQLYRLYPLQLGWLGDQVYVVKAVPGYQYLVGARLLKVGETDLMDALAALSPYISHENTAGLKNRSRVFLLNVDLLQHVGILQAELNKPYLFELPDGTQLRPELEIVPNYDDMIADMSGPTLPAVPLREQNPDDYYWFTYLEDEQVLYFRYRRCIEMFDRPIRRFVDELFAELDSRPVGLLVIDLRGNGGGASNLLDAFIARLSQHAINQPAKLFVLHDMESYSSAVFNLVALRQQTEAIFIGEPTSTSPDHYGQYERFYLPNSLIQVQYSTSYFAVSRLYDDNLPLNTGDKLGGWGYALPAFPVSPPATDTFVPDIVMSLALEDYLSGHDPLLNLVIKENLAQRSLP